LSALTTLILFIGFNQASGQQALDFTIALELARKNNPDWKAAEHEVEIARGKLSTARLISPFNPTVEGQTGRRTTPGEGNGNDYGVGLSMELEVAGQRGMRITEAERNFQRAEAGFKDFGRTFTAKLARAYYQAVFARSRFDFAKKVEDLNRRLAEVTRVKFDAGDISGLEVNVATVRYALSRKETLDAERNLTQALLELRRLIGVEERVSPSETLAAMTPPVLIGDTLQRALENRPDLLAKKRELERAESEIALRRREVVPNPTVGVFFNREASGERAIVGGLSIPLPVFNRRQGELESLEARRSQARAELLAVEKEIRKEVDQAINEWETARKNADLFQREVIEQTEENFRLLEAAYRERRIDLPRLLIMENDFISANQSYLDVLQSLREAAIKLQEVTGEVK